ncbi:MAG: hypothetical protein EBS93_08410 [Chitinophagia bacterium]|nr:hypothetical protein [Chitinophagia bacterium]NCA30723.1 hypothetical protein [Chitinophagia bacterium]
MNKTQQIVASAPKFRKGRDDPFRSTEAAPPAETPPATKQKTESPYTETTTLPLSKEQKELIEDLGTKLQRQKVGPKKPELNWKSILRGMIGLLDEHTFDGVSVATEEELHQVIKKKFG